MNTLRLTLRRYAKTALMSAVEQFGENFLFVFDYALRFLRVALLLSIWRILLAGKGAVDGLTLPAVLTYTLIAEVFADPLACRTWLEDAFWDGSIAGRFLRPMPIFGQFAAQMFGKWLFGLGAFSLPLLLLSPLLGVNPLPASAAAGGLFVVSLVLAVGVGLAIEYIFAGVAIALDVHPYAINSVRAAISGLLSGAFLPLALLPWGLGRVFGLLPFASTASAPLQLYIGRGNTLQLLGLQVLWAVILWPIAIRLWRANQERMVSRGG